MKEQVRVKNENSQETEAKSLLNYFQSNIRLVNFSNFHGKQLQSLDKRFLIDSLMQNIHLFDRPSIQP